MKWDERAKHVDIICDVVIMFKKLKGQPDEVHIDEYQCIAVQSCIPGNIMQHDYVHYRQLYTDEYRGGDGPTPHRKLDIPLLRQRFSCRTIQGLG